MRQETRLRVLFLNHVSLISGAEQSLLSILRPLQNRGVTPLVALAGQGPLAEEIRSLDIHVIPLKAGRLLRRVQPLRQVRWILDAASDRRTLANIARQKDIQIYHANSTPSCLVASLCPLCRPLFWHARDLNPPRLLSRRLASASSRVIAISQGVRSCLASQGVPDAKITVVHNGVDPLWLKPERETGARLREAWGIRPETLLVGTVGQLVPWKRHEDLIEAVATLRDRGLDVQGVIVGEDLFGDDLRYKTFLKDLASSRGAGCIQLMGYIENIKPVMEALDVLVCASDAEPFGRVLLEAMSCAKPVVATRSGGVPEVVAEGETGILVDPRSPGQLARSIEELMKSPEITASMGQAGRKRILEEFGVEKVAEKLFHLYHEIWLEAGGCRL